MPTDPILGDPTPVWKYNLDDPVEPGPPERQPDGLIPPVPPPVIKHVTRYKASSGRVLGQSQLVSTAAPPAEQAFYDGHDVDLYTQYIDTATGLPADRTDNPATLDAEEVTVGQQANLTNIPAGSDVWIVGMDMVRVDDGVLTMDTSTPGEYEISLDEAQHLPKMLKLKVMSP